jgi:hypothetical protein
MKEYLMGKIPRRLERESALELAIVWVQGWPEVEEPDFFCGFGEGGVARL